ncbi:hypothetical protein [Micromonospora eburnea]|uniref:Uncharacterized protein n=1 Tax=Micromonospora eburnea TaxID=227316 RepID=A0A1C6VE12_9ACTN|nr:hypothetical protein [Micromonospora eburnea]SCL64274.1 hypothetical protein GA0070604_5170 [Micromonospora eburnea]
MRRRSSVFVRLRAAVGESSPTGVPAAGLRLTDTRTSASGVTMLTYDSAGAPTFGAVM